MKQPSKLLAIIDNALDFPKSFMYFPNPEERMPHNLLVHLLRMTDAFLFSKSIQATWSFSSGSLTFGAI